ncbi:hypothetical protein CNR22_06450 [Sphingobacteriaceae bacterium]|nr:hypothetical protein CNR22_06450 [Sphingobacteriaceae bacterium]
MKKTILLFSLLCCLLGFSTMNAQAPSMVLSPQNQCFSASGTTATAYVASGFPGATSFSWAAISDSCVASITSYSNGGFVTINYPCCGNYTVLCAGFNGSVGIGVITQTASISCSSGSSVSISGANSTCNGTSVILTGSGSSSYTWMPGVSHSTSIAVTPTASSCYTLYGTTCSGISSAVKCVSVNFSPIFISGNQSICAGYGATLSALGASSYTWYTSQGTYTGSTIVLTPSVTSCYSVIATTSAGCTGYSGGCITVSSGSASPLISGNMNLCQGSSTALYASGASSYTWLPGGSNSTTLSVISPSTTTCYTLIGAGCSGTSSAVRCVTVNPIPVLSVSGNTSICAGNGSTLTAGGASTYTWYTSQGTFTGSTIVLTPTATACYTLAGRSLSGCTGYLAGCISVFAPNPITISGTSVICPGATAYLYASGSSNYTWTPGGISGDSIAVTPSVSTCYYAFGTSTTGCVSYGYKCVTVQADSISIYGSSGICSGNNLILYASGGSNYTWTPGGSNSSSIVVSPTTSACYTLTGLSCSGLSSAVKCVSVSPAPVISVSGATSICSGYGTTLTASGASYYTWYTSQGTYTGSTIVLTPTATACYSLVGYSSSSCPGYAAGCITVQNSINLTVSGDTALCKGMTTTLTAAGANTYTWFPSGYVGSSIVVTPTATTCFTLVGYSPNSCGSVISKVVCVTVSGSPVITTSSPVFCAGQSNTLHAFGATSYTWYPYNVTGANIVITPSVGSCYTVVGTNSTGCNGYATGCYSVLPAPTVSVIGSNLICAGAPTTLTAVGAQTYTWYPSNTSGASIAVNPLTPTCYTVVGTNYGCTGYAVKCLSVQTGPTLTVIGNNQICAGSTTTLSASGASSYTWLPGNLTGASIAVSPSVSTCYTVVGTHSAGCVGLGYHCVSLAPNPNIAVYSSSVVCAGSQLLLHAFGAATYTWLPYNISDTSIVISPSVSNCYTVLGTSAAGCTGSAIGCFSVIPSSTLFVTGPSSICAGASPVLASGGAGSYTWMPGNLTGSAVVVSPSVTTCYTVIGSNANGCNASAVKCIAVQSGAQLNISGANLVCSGTSANLLASGAITYTWSNGSNSPFITVTPTAPVCYTVSGTTSGGCTGTAVKCISVQATPFIAINGPSQVCSGTSAILTASGATSYVWSNGTNTYSTLILPYVTTVYSVTGSNGVCSSTKAFTVVANPRPSISIFRTDSVLTNDSIVCAGDAVNLYATGAITYTWSTGNTLPYITVYPTGITNYTVSGTNTYGCSNSNFITVYAMACTGLSKNSSNLEIGMYPNPSSGKLILQGNGVNTVNYKVVDMLGRELLTGEFVDTKDLNLSGFANGTYVIRFESGAATTYKKLVLENK